MWVRFTLHCTVLSTVLYNTTQQFRCLLSLARCSFSKIQDSRFNIMLLLPPCRGGRATTVCFYVRKTK